jgi:hypothetical protein
MARTAMTREEKVALVEFFLECIVSKDIDRLPITSDLTAQSPLTPPLRGAAAMAYLKTVASAVKRIRCVQHIVEDDHVATFLEEETVQGVSLPIFSKFRIESGRIADVRVFYDARLIVGSADGR